MRNVSAQAMWQLSDDEFVRQFPKLPRVLQLKERSPFPREDRVVFYEHDHSYTVDGQRVPRSVTSLLHEYATPFDPMRALASMKRSRDWETKREAMVQQRLGTSDDDVLEKRGRS